MPVNDRIHPCTAWALKRLEYQGTVNIVTHSDSDRIKDSNPARESYINCSRSRNKAKEKALNTNADWFLSLDSDVSPPLNCLQTFSKSAQELGPAQHRDAMEGTKMACIGGWYPQKFIETIIENGTKHKVQRWVAGFFRNNLFVNYLEPRLRKYAPTGLVPLGCAFIHRDVLEMTEFRSGCDKGQETADSITGKPLFWGECVEFANQLYDLGETCFMHPKVICQHWRN